MAKVRKKRRGSGRRTTYLLVIPDYKPGDPAPQGYLQWHEWADVQVKAKLKQTHCPTCGKWHFPQEVKKSCGKQTSTREWNSLVRRMEKKYPADKGETEWIEPDNVTLHGMTGETGGEMKNRIIFELREQIKKWHEWAESNGVFVPDYLKINPR